MSTTLCHPLRRLLRDVRGGTDFIEYLVLVGVIAVGGWAGFRFISSSIAAKANVHAAAIGQLGAEEGRTFRVETTDLDQGTGSPISMSTAVVATVALLLVLGVAFTLWMRARHARGELATLPGSGASAGEERRS